jgi:hypothetical protein
MKIDRRGTRMNREKIYVYPRLSPVNAFGGAELMANRLIVALC